MFEIDPRLRGLPATRDQVVSLFQSINAPYLAVPGKPAGPAQCFIVGLRGHHGLGSFVYLHLADSGDCAVYVAEPREVPPEAFARRQADALAFVESMGFMMDDLNFRALPPEEQERLLRSLPVFQRGPTLAAAPAAKAAPAATPLDKLGRLLASV